ncbi:TetR/AcrR family transcriptional regulator C-terminal domain-containing protein [Actinomadura sp. ATCC 31491]|uniref:TetR/AcrR family transcriptional regulator C-terminal domain-containing protein n=1 Tax=Actinomadura luzonensis TaxID=2805427 RepID=A0ABT0G1A7_9ACTN|nr:TetR/AcrR family transcriptional regulator C-terminal domain-containing protein [Actinomadura luzonensis]MCK2218381.1 TetR/AcrR family transcriptional regulator C-terminal domain-containing protein [Actinomadura luzonensis]
MTADPGPPSGLPEPPTRPALTREYLALAALALIDAHGLRKFSMRKLGTAVGFDPMAVYRHYDDQEALFDGVAEALFDEVDAGSLPWDGPWRELAREYCTRLRDVLLRHPHAVQVFATRPVRSPASIDTGVRMLAKLHADGIPPADALRLARCLREFTVGHALSIAVARLGAERRSRKPEPGSPGYNLLAEAADATALDDHFALGLTALLRGFRATG